MGLISLAFRRVVQQSPSHPPTRFVVGRGLQTGSPPNNPPPQRTPQRIAETLSRRSLDPVCECCARVLHVRPHTTCVHRRPALADCLVPPFFPFAPLSRCIHSECACACVGRVCASALGRRSIVSLLHTTNQQRGCLSGAGTHAHHPGCCCCRVVAPPHPLRRRATHAVLLLSGQGLACARKSVAVLGAGCIAPLLNASVVVCQEFL